MGQATSRAQAAFPFPVATTQAARQLIRIHQYLRGELLKGDGHEDLLVRPDECHQQMKAIETVLAFMPVNFDPRALKAKRAFPKIGPLEYGKVRAGALSALKRAGSWLTYNQVLEDICAAYHLELSAGQRKHLLQKLREGLHALKRVGAVECERPGARLGDNSFEQRWRLSAMFS
jgi:hypothetical protein